ncbi:MAG: hypothetical protein N3D84_01775, partial [Candidatus Woesearchaeota archaeon]|nr:hypothetical protein [Candidatus Woesearchaeota archaeon]
NFTGILQNYTITGNNGDVYYYNINNLAAGYYAWRMIANDTSGNYNSTPYYTYSVIASAPKQKEHKKKLEEEIGISRKGGEVKKVLIEEKEIVYTNKTVDIIKNRDKNTTVHVINLYENSYLTNIKIEIEGEMSRYAKLNLVPNYQKKVLIETINIELKKFGVPFAFTLGKEQHKVTAERIDALTVRFIIESTPKNVTVKVGDIVYIDLNDDTESDIALYLKNVSDSKVEFSISQLGSPYINNMYFMEERNWTISLLVPDYFEQDEFNLTVKVSGDIVAINSSLAGFERKPFVEYKKIIVNVGSEEKIIQCDEETLTLLERARSDIKEMMDAGLPYTKTRLLLVDAEKAYVEYECEITVKLSNKIREIKEYGFIADNYIKRATALINKAKRIWITSSKVDKTLNFAISSFKEEDFITAIEKARYSIRLLIIEIIWRCILLTTLALLVTLVTIRRYMKHNRKRMIETKHKAKKIDQNQIKRTSFILFKQLILNAINKAIRLANSFKKRKIKQRRIIQSYLKERTPFKSRISLSALMQRENIKSWLLILIFVAALTAFAYLLARLEVIQLLLKLLQKSSSYISNANIGEIVFISTISFLVFCFITLIIRGAFKKFRGKAKKPESQIFEKEWKPRKQIKKIEAKKLGTQPLSSIHVVSFLSNLYKNDNDNYSKSFNISLLDDLTDRGLNGKENEKIALSANLDGLSRAEKTKTKPSKDEIINHINNIKKKKIVIEKESNVVKELKNIYK